MSNPREIIIGVDPGATGGWSAVYVEPDVDRDIHYMTGGLLPYLKPVPRLPGTSMTQKYKAKPIDQHKLWRTWHRGITRDGAARDKFFLPHDGRDTVTIVIEEPPVWMAKRRGQKDSTNGASQAILARYLEGCLYTFSALLPHATIYTVLPRDWQNAILTRYIPKASYTNLHTDAGIYPGKDLDTKQRAYLACICEFGHDWMQESFGGFKTKGFRSAVCDATCIALFAADKLDAGITRLSCHPDTLRSLYTRKEIPARTDKSQYAFG